MLKSGDKPDLILVSTFIWRSWSSSHGFGQRYRVTSPACVHACVRTYGRYLDSCVVRWVDACGGAEQVRRIDVMVYRESFRCRDSSQPVRRVTTVTGYGSLQLASPLCRTTSHSDATRN